MRPVKTRPVIVLHTTSLMESVFNNQPLFNEASLGRVYHITQSRNVGMITANRAANTRANDAEASKQLELSIRSHFGIIKVKAFFKEDGEQVFLTSFLVLGKEGDDSGSLLGFLKQEGKRYDQDAILYKSYGDDHAYLIGLKDGALPGPGVTHDTGVFHPNRAREYLSMLKREPITFEAIQFCNVRSFFSRRETEI